MHLFGLEKKYSHFPASAVQAMKNIGPRHNAFRANGLPVAFEFESAVEPDGNLKRVVAMRRNVDRFTPNEDRHVPPGHTQSGNRAALTHALLIAMGTEMASA